MLERENKEVQSELKISSNAAMDDLLKKLFIVDDINHLSYEELVDKYLGNEKDYSTFLKRYYGFVSSNHSYQLRMGKIYDKIVAILIEGENRYLNFENNKDSENKEYHKKILQIIAANRRNFAISKNMYEDIQESYCSFGDIIGKNINTYEEYLDVSRQMLMSAIKYYFLDDKKEALKPKFYSFYKSFLYFINYVISEYPNTVDFELKEILRKMIELENSKQRALGILVTPKDDKRLLKTSKKNFNKISS